MGAEAIEFPRPARRSVALRRRSDEHLARACARGESAPFELLFERHHRQLLSFCRHMLGRAHDAEDAVQHVFAAAHRLFGDGTVPDNVRAWLYTVARNRCLSILRARRDQPGYHDVDLPSTENLADDVQRRTELQDLLGDVRSLPSDQRAALLLAELGDLSHEEIAAVIGVPRQKVKALVFQAREALLVTAEARALPCADVRAELATATGAALRRKHLRRHVEVCDGCRDYRDAIKRQRTALAVVLPVVPSLALREAIVGGIGGGGAAAAAGGIAGLLGKTAVTKVATGLVVAGGVAGGGAAVVETVDRPSARTAKPAAVTAAPSASPIAPGAGDRGTQTPPAASRPPAGKGKRPAPSRGAAPAVASDGPKPSRDRAKGPDRRRQAAKAVAKGQRTAAKAQRKAIRELRRQVRPAAKPGPRPGPKPAKAKRRPQAAAPNGRLDKDRSRPKGEGTSPSTPSTRSKGGSGATPQKDGSAQD